MQAQGPVQPDVEEDKDGGVSESKESESNRISSTQPGLEEEEEPPGLVDDSDSEDDRPSQWDEAHRWWPERDGAGPDGSEPGRSTPKLARVDAEDELPGASEDIDSEDDRPSLCEEASSRRQPPADDVPDLIDDWPEPNRSAPSATY